MAWKNYIKRGIKRMKKSYPSLDLFKFIFSIVVVSIHTLPFIDFSESFSWYYNAVIGNVAVPFFFVTSGYLLFKKLDVLNKEDRYIAMKNYVWHILRMYIVWTVIWLPWKILNFITMDHLTGWDIVVYFRDVLIGHSGDALWYLPALAFAVYIVYKMDSAFNRLSILKIWLIIYCIGALISSLFEVLPFKSVVVFYHTIFENASVGFFYCGFLYGGLFVAIGAWLAKEQQPFPVKRSFSV